VWGAYQNVLINLKDVKEDDVREKVRGLIYNFQLQLLLNSAFYPSIAYIGKLTSGWG